MSDLSAALPPLLGRLARWAGHVGLWRKLAIGLAVAALVAGVATYGALSGWGPFGDPAPRTVLVLLNIDLVVALLLSAVVLRNLVKLWLERRRGSAGSRLHTRIVALFSVVAVAPAIIVAVFSVLFLHFGVESWFSDRVRTAVEESVAVAEAYLDEHRQVIRADALAMANDINRSGPSLVKYPRVFNRFLRTQAALRSLTEAMVFRRDGRVLGRTGLTFSLVFEPVPFEAMNKADEGEAVILTADSDDRVRALVRLDAFVDSYLYVGRFVDSRAIGHVERTQRAVSAYERLEGQRSDIQITFALIFGVVTLLLLLAAVWLGLTFANQLAWPISRLITAAERVRFGDLNARVKEGPPDDELGSLSRAFNRMTVQLADQRGELVEANRQIDARRRFIESVLSGVSAGVIGLDSEGRIELPNRSALVLLASESEALVGRRLSEAVPEIAPLLAEAMTRPTREVERQIAVVRDGRTRNLRVRISAERLGSELEGFVVTFDDITALLTAQRAAAWADVARRIAHEIKNPLTPIQLSAERLRRKYRDEIRSDPDVFAACTETIVRHVGDIGRMVDEFSAFARMPAPVMRSEDLVELVGQAIDLQALAHPEVAFVRELPASPVRLRCDSRQVVQVMTNVLQNAVDAIAERERPASGELEPGRVRVAIESRNEAVVVEIGDNGRGLPAEQRHRLAEPYVTTRASGTGLGLAIVRKIMEDHGGEFVIKDAPGGGACVRLVFAVRDSAAGAASGTKATRVSSHGT